MNNTSAPVTESNARQQSQKPIIEMTGVDLSFGERLILKDLELKVEREERMVILGQSGAGKSTLLRLILGVIAPNAGQVYFDGHNVFGGSTAEMNAIRTKIGMVYQSAALISSFSVRDNLALPLEELTRKRRPEIDRIIQEKLAIVGLADAGPLMPAQLSGGMRKRVAIARALVMEPELLLFDEPTTGLDPVLAAVIDELIIELSHKAHTTFIVVTHELTSAFRVATRMAMLYQGRIIAEERPEPFRTMENPVVRQFIEGRTEGPIQ